MAKKYRIRLSPEEREQLQNIVKAGKVAASKRQRAQILLAVPQPAASDSLNGTGAAALHLNLPGGAHATITTPQQVALAAQLLKALTPSASC